MADTIDEQFVEYIVKALVADADAVTINRTIDERGVLLELHVAPADLGRVIGRNGTTAKSIRTLLRALGVKNDARYNLKIMDDNEGERRPPREEYNAAGSAPVVDSEGEKTYAAEDLEQPDHSEQAQGPNDTVEYTSEDVVTPNTEVQDEEEQTDNMAKHRDDLRNLTDLDI